MTTLDVKRRRFITKEVKRQHGRYVINEIFHSLQGEGARAGSVNVFVRFSKCNLACPYCDTEYETGTEHKLSELMDRIDVICNQRFASKNIIFTGGEPTLQLDSRLVNRFKDAGYYLAIETNGLILGDYFPLLDWVTVAPKTSERGLKVQTCNELKYPIKYGDVLPTPSIHADHFYISPIFNQEPLDSDESPYRKNLDWCIRLLKGNGTRIPWKLSMQQHKVWEVR